MDNGIGLPARIKISEDKDGKLLSQLEWPNSVGESCTVAEQTSTKSILFPLLTAWVNLSHVVGTTVKLHAEK